ncbi:MAG: ABC transporter permease [Alphaproteobacteria bacterium]|nr:ABC transporter permease [Alphaproteobacteria bacterium]
MSGPRLAAMAWRNLWRNRRRTVLTLISISFGLFLAILMTAMQDRSFADMIDTAARLGGGHVTLQHPEYLDTPTLTRTVTDAPALITTAQADPGVRKAVPRITGQIMLATAGESYGAFFVAYDPTQEDDTTLSFLGGVTQGELFEAADGPGIVLGTRLARNLGLEMGDKVVYTLMDREGEIVGGLARLSGVVDTGSPATDGGLCLLPIDALRRTLSYGPGEATQVAVFLTDARASGRVAERLGDTIGADTASLTWQQVQPDLSGFIAMKVGGARFMELVTLILVAASIFNTLFVSVMERMREFGIMRAIGFSPGQLFRLIMWESFWLALVGCVMGGLITLGPYHKLASTGIDVSAMSGGQSMDVAGVGMAPILQVGIFPENLAIILLSVVLATLLSGVYPAWKAGRVVPIETIRLQ